AFAASGGTPLLAVRLARLLTARGFRAGARDLTEHTTLAGLTDLLLARGNPLTPTGIPDSEVPGRAGVSEEYLEQLFASTQGAEQENR
ncbi:hypothetical protein, partial [Streptomyces lydicus]